MGSICGSPNKEDVWQDQRIVWDGTKKCLDMAPGERIAHEWKDTIEDSTGRLLGSLIITSLRVMWISIQRKKEKPLEPKATMSIGLKCVQCVHFNSTESETYGRSRAVCLTGVFNNETYEFSFACPESSAMAVFMAAENWHKRYKATRPFRETMIRELKMFRHGVFIPYYPEVLQKQFEGVENIAASKLYDGVLSVSDYRLIWTSAKSSIVNVSVPFSQIRSISRRILPEGHALVVTAGNVSSSKKPSHFPQSQCGQAVLAFLIKQDSHIEWLMRYADTKQKELVESPFFMPHDGRVVYKESRWMVVQVEEDSDVEGDSVGSSRSGSHEEIEEIDENEAPSYPKVSMELPSIGEFIVDEGTTRKRKKADDAEARSPAARAYKSDPKCVICLDQRADTVFDPCGHLCTCFSCGGSIKECPMCRVALNKCLKVFVVS